MGKTKMFERYSEKARRVLFFARYEASQFGSSYIQPEHLLLGLVREDKALSIQFLPSHAAEAIREQIEARTTKGEKISTTVDLPLNADSKRVLAFAAEEAPIGEIGTAHLLIGILRLTHFASEILHGYGLSLETVRKELEGVAPKGSVKKAHSKPTACRDCRHLIVDKSEKPIEWTDLFCAASPKKPTFDCYTGELREPKPDSPLPTRFQFCSMINFGECRLFEPNEELTQNVAETE
jgi:ATP-dependent Clp protease ATP-binding subunit ClpA